MKNKKSIDEQIETIRKNIRKELEVWHCINETGCNDPSWPDGCNMNLTRNHIIYYKRQLEEICIDRSFPEEYFLPTPPEVDDEYLASSSFRQKERIETLRRLGDNIKKTGKNKFDDSQMAL